MGKVLKLDKKTGFTSVGLVRHIRKQMIKEGYPQKLFKHKEAS